MFTPGSMWSGLGMLSVFSVTNNLSKHAESNRSSMGQYSYSRGKGCASLDSGALSLHPQVSDKETKAQKGWLTHLTAPPRYSGRENLI